MYDTTKQNASKGTWADEGEKMSKVEDYGVDLTKKYSIWKFELTEEDLEKYNAAVFYFRYGNDWMRYSTVTLHAGGSDTEYGNVTENDQNNWTKYIYATYSKDVNGQKEFTLSETLVAPNEITLEGQFVAERFNEETNKWVYGIYVKGLDIQYVKENLHGYSDFSFDCGSRTDSWQQRHQEDLQGNRDMLQLGPGRRLVELPASGCVIQHRSRVYPRCG